MTTDQEVFAGRYELRRRIGTGGAGHVWRAHDRDLEREVAIKRVRLPDHVDDEELGRRRQRVLREARAAARLDHPGVVSVYDVISEGDAVAIVMALVDAPNLKEVVVDKGPLDDQRAAQIGLAILDALEAAHEAGIVHRDVKPSNVLVPEGRVKLTDFGIAAVTDDADLTRTGEALGSPGYIAPEQAKGEIAEPSADLWALGATLWFMVEGEPPFDRGRPISTIHAVINEDPGPAYSESELLPLIRRLMSKAPEARPAAAEVRAELEPVAAWGGSRPEGEERTERDVTATVAMADVGGGPEPARGSRDETAVQQPLRGSRDETEVQEPQPAAPAALMSVRGPTDRDGQGGRSRDDGTGRTVAWVMAGVFAVVVGSLVWLWVGTTDDIEGGEVANEPAPATETEAGTADEAGEDPTQQTTSEPTTEASPTQEATPSPTEASPTEASPSPTGEAGPMNVPDGWEVFEGPAYSIGHPAGWEAQNEDGPRIDLTDPDTGAYLRLDYTDNPAEDPVEDWQQQSASFADRHEGYEEIRIESVDYRDYDAAIWEYEYSAGGQRLHAVNLGFTDGECGYALNLQAPAELWSDYEQLFSDFKQTFRAEGC